MSQNSCTRTVAFLLKRFDCNDGVASHCETLIGGLVARDWKVVMITGAVSYDDESIDRFNRIQALVEDWVVISKFNATRPSWSNMAQINQAIQRLQPSLLHAHGYSMLIVARLLYIFKRIKCVATFHPSIQGNDPKSLAVRALNPEIRKYRLYLSLFTPSRFIAYSSENVSFLEQDLGVKPEKVRKILLGIDTSYFCSPTVAQREAARKQFGMRPSDFVCTLVGRMNWNKGHDILIDAVRQVKHMSQTENLVCLFFGSGCQEPEIKAYALQADDHPGTYVFGGYVQDLREAYWASDVFVLPSRSEGFALVVAEAMCCGIPCIRTPSGGATDQIQHGQNGLIIPFDDASGLAQHLQTLVADRAWLQSLASQALSTARQKFALEIMIEKTISLYAEIAQP